MRRTTYTWNSGRGRDRTTLLVNESAGIDLPILDVSGYDIFISHKGDDMALAIRAGDVLHDCGLQGYLDQWDPEVDGDTPELEIHLREVIRKPPQHARNRLREHQPFMVGTIRDRRSERN